ncbi:hypothetical protein PR003_g4490 [Phytophthora rubi]|uniref:Apple domain-containing protein n=1 Tax=Phytophthora rubi TaxID=129364 RepID=A0A6A4FST2_9STRA|nr:hypothetical protein PR001_g4232 [Phytophthora rubi]KAE9352221.1 hypothetical protein PR003_g4490 [Phytophthora rubi]
MAEAAAPTGPPTINVLHDATFSIPVAHGPICSGNEHGPFGIACPRRGDTASANCHSDHWSFNGAQCVAPANAQCVKVSRATWACVFPAKPQFFKEQDDHKLKELASPTVSPATTSNPCTDSGPNKTPDTLLQQHYATTTASTFKSCCDECWNAPNCNSFALYVSPLEGACKLSSDSGPSATMPATGWPAGVTATGYFSVTFKQ